MDCLCLILIRIISKKENQANSTAAVPITNSIFSEFVSLTQSSSVTPTEINNPLLLLSKRKEEMKKRDIPTNNKKGRNEF